MAAEIAVGRPHSCFDRKGQSLPCAISESGCRAAPFMDHMLQPVIGKGRGISLPHRGLPQRNREWQRSLPGQAQTAGPSSMATARDGRLRAEGSQSPPRNTTLRRARWCAAASDRGKHAEAHQHLPEARQHPKILGRHSPAPAGRRRPLRQGQLFDRRLIIASASPL